ncbi:hypothetical protein [Sporosarcina aquimarina]|uniref:DUF4303 domain-containing protein n=1 Tax=Sporosarcina aquimarina TaxID=114975 RepID=A0ABU4G1C3_9BACL|nr:hypothetical protein [Sporosarcina aquimarina]MDW0110666.1 hypothetical protein [Sporosarcina aquimarina]
MDDQMNADMMIEQQLKQALSGIAIGFSLSRDYGDGPFYRYFNNEKKRNRAQSLLVFTALLGSWHAGHDVFYSKEYLNNCTYIPPEPGHRLDDYLHAFLDHSETIQKEFPHMHSDITFYLFTMDQETAFETSFPKMSPLLFERMRQDLFIEPEFDPNNQTKNIYFDDLLIEAGDEDFFERGIY